MSDGTHYRQQIEQALATIFTCRSIIRFNPELNEEQKQELLTEIDTTLQFLQSRLIAHALSEDALPTPVPPGESSQPSTEMSSKQAGSQGREQDQHEVLQALYKLYHVYLGSTQTQSKHAVLNTFIIRFNDIMYTIRGIHESKNYLTASYPTAIDEQLQRIKGYIAELYYIFMEFIRTISTILQINDIHIDTDELPPAPKQATVNDQQTTLQEQQSLAAHETARLQNVYEAHQKLNTMKGGIANRVGDTIALIAYLKESFGWELKKRDDLTARLNTIPPLLNDLANLLAEYENAINALLKEQE